MSFGMHCPQCQKSLRSSEGVKCSDCESRFHVKCVATKGMEDGDRGYQWKCAVCQHPAGKCGSHSQLLMSTLSQISEKFELVNKIQLPKLNSDLVLLKSTADRIVKQNEDILNKISQLQRSDQKKSSLEVCQSKAQSRSHRRPLNFMRPTTENSEEVPIISASDKCARYKTRRRSYHLYKVFLLVNRKLHRTRTPRNKSPC